MKLGAIIFVGVFLSAILLSTMYPQTNNENTSDEVYYELENFDSYDSLTDYLSSNFEQTYGSFWNLGSERMMSSKEMSDGEISSPSLDESVAGQSVDYSETNVQVTGVDEPDIVKTDGTYLYIVSNNKVIIVKAYPSEDAEIISEIALNDTLTLGTIFISGSRLVVFADTYYQPIFEKADIIEGTVVPRWYSSQDTYIKIYDLEDIIHPILIKEIVVGGSFSEARLIGEYIYVITIQYSYDVGYYPEENQNVVPRLLVDDELREVPLSDIYYVDLPEKSNTITNILSVNIQDDSEAIIEKIFILGNGQTMYVSGNNIYITYATQYYNYEVLDEIINEIIMPHLPESIKSQLENVKTLTLEDYQKQTITQWILQEYIMDMDEDQVKDIANEVSRRTERTIIHRISISDGNIEYKAQGDVPGFVNNQFSISEYDGHLRVSTTLQGWMIQSFLSSIESQNNVYVLDMDLEVVGSLEDLASGEQIYATRFIRDTCYLVTFRQIDPFFVIDLSNPTSPEVLGELKIPGFSTYLHPYDDTHIIGIGRNGSNVKISLFEVTDPSNPIELSNYEIVNSENSWGWSESIALYEHKAFLFDKEKNLLVIPAGIYYKQSAYVFDISIDDGITFSGNISHDYETQQESEEEYDYYYWYDSGNSIKRTLYIDDVLYTLSDNMVKMNNLETLNEINSIVLV